MNSLNTNNIKWSENVIIADADYIDKVAFDLIVNFERMINRRIQPADMAQWAVCIALDGGLREGEHETQLVLIHSQQSKAMQNFRPSDYEKDLNAQAFKDPRLGEFVISSYPTEEKMVGKDDFLVDVARTVCNAKEVKRVMIIPNSEEGDAYDQLRDMLRKVDDEKRVTARTHEVGDLGDLVTGFLQQSLVDDDAESLVAVADGLDSALVVLQVEVLGGHYGWPWWLLNL